MEPEAEQARSITGRLCALENRDICCGMYALECQNEWRQGVVVAPLVWGADRNPLVSLSLPASEVLLLQG